MPIRSSWSTFGAVSHGCWANEQTVNSSCGVHVALSILTRSALTWRAGMTDCVTRLNAALEGRYAIGARRRHATLNEG